MSAFFPDASDGLAGALWLFPGQAVPRNLRSTRRPLASRLVSGRPPAAALPDMLASLFNLCGHAHRLCSALAIGVAARGRAAAQPIAAAQDLRRETAAEHVRRIGLDWPRLLTHTSCPADGTAALHSLRACPLMNYSSVQAGLDWRQVHDWLQAQWLGMAPAAWLRAWQACGSDWLDDWSRRQGWLPALLRAAKTHDIALPLRVLPSLRAHGSRDALRRLGDVLGQQGDSFTARPRWQGQCMHTGTWSRLRDQVPVPLDTAWALLGCRLAELTRLCLPDGVAGQGAAWLDWGGIATGPGRGLAWVEMARGLLIHQVGIGDAGDSGQAVATSCQVLAPTEWNFHPEGIAAQALARLPSRPAEAGARVGLLMAALDPCVPFRLDSAAHPAPRTQVCHA